MVPPLVRSPRLLLRSKLVSTCTTCSAPNETSLKEQTVRECLKSDMAQAVLHGPKSCAADCAARPIGTSHCMLEEAHACRRDQYKCYNGCALTLSASSFAQGALLMHADRRAGHCCMKLPECLYLMQHVIDTLLKCHLVTVPVLLATVDWGDRGCCMLTNALQLPSARRCQLCQQEHQERQA